MKRFSGSQTMRGGPHQLKKGVAGKTLGARRSRRLARRGGVKRMSGLIYHETRTVIKAHLSQILKLCCIYVDYRNAKTVTVQDVLYALRQMGRTLYGFDPAVNSAAEKLRRNKQVVLRS
ncbi:hypothetical protein MY1884_003278 [Beauveria asiatica]